MKFAAMSSGRSGPTSRSYSEPGSLQNQKASHRALHPSRARSGSPAESVSAKRALGRKHQRGACSRRCSERCSLEASEAKAPCSQQLHQLLAVVSRIADKISQTTRLKAGTMSSCGASSASLCCRACSAGINAGFRGLVSSSP